MSEAIELLGKFINSIITHVVRSERVEFCVPSLVCEIPGEKLVTVYQERPVSDPSECPGAFDPHKTLNHINSNPSTYSLFIGPDLKDTIERILKEISKNWHATDLSWESTITSMTIMEDFMEQVTNGLDGNKSPEAPDLMESLQEYLKEIRKEIGAAQDVQKLLFKTSS